MTAEQLRDRLLAAFPGAKVRVEDTTGTHDHFDAEVAAKEFVGRSRIEQHQLVYGALGEAMKQEIHALALKTSEIE